MDLQTKKDIFIKMNRAIVTCKKCRLCRGRINAVPGEGNINAKVVFIGEAPGFEEDKQGRPFVGRSGLLLGEMINKIGLKRTDVWIGNVIKCRPPENRNPLLDEIRACKPYLEKQMELIKPKIIVTLGRFALEFLVPKAKISEAHGKPIRVKSYIVFPIYHPAAALRNVAIKKIMIEDFMKIKNLINIDIKSITNEAEKKEDTAQLSLF